MNFSTSALIKASGTTTWKFAPSSAELRPRIDTAAKQANSIVGDTMVAYETDVFDIQKKVNCSAGQQGKVRRVQMKLRMAQHQLE